MHVTALSMGTFLRAELLLIPELPQSIDALVTFQVYAAPVASIAAVWAPKRHVLLSSETDDPVPTPASLNMYASPVYQLAYPPSVLVRLIIYMSLHAGKNNISKTVDVGEGELRRRWIEGWKSWDTGTSVLRGCDSKGLVRGGEGRTET